MSDSRMIWHRHARGEREDFWRLRAGRFAHFPGGRPYDFRLLLPHLRTLLSPPAALHSEPARLTGLGLTHREQEVFFWVSEGKRNREVAEILGIAPAR